MSIILIGVVILSGIFLEETMYFRIHLAPLDYDLTPAVLCSIHSQYKVVSIFRGDASAHTL